MNIAVLLPCYNEGPAIYGVVNAFRAALPGAMIYVYDNNSSDNTIAEATRAGAIVRRETRQGKGHVLRRMFSDIDADIYVMADGDGTYDAGAAPALVDQLLRDRLDVVLGVRVHDKAEAYRPGHVFGNWFLTTLVQMFFGRGFTDMLSGYRVMSRRYVKSFPALARAFETETEMCIHALHLNMPFGEAKTAYFERCEGTASKLRTFRDGFRVLNMIMLFVKEIKPILFFGLVALLLAFLGLCFGIPVILDYIDTGLVPRLPSAVLSATLMVLAALSFLCGIILDSVSRGRQEQKRLFYLSQPWMLHDPHRP